jgi:polysaccharide pyruvyl transferase WcaK-like protein
MRATPRNVAVFGNFGSDNLGNEASLQAMLDFVRRTRPDLPITCICYRVEQAQAEHEVSAIPIKLQGAKHKRLGLFGQIFIETPLRVADIVRTFYLARHFDLFIIPGTGILDDFSERWRAMPFDLFKWSLAAKFYGRPFVFVSIGAGPILHPISRWLLVSAAKMARYRSYRDTSSKSYMHSLGVAPLEDPVFPDLVFNLPVPKHPSCEFPDRLPTVGVGIMHYFGWDRSSPLGPAIHDTYLGQMTQFVCWLLDHGYRVRLLMGARSDQLSINEVLRRVAAQRGQPVTPHLIVEPAHSLQELMLQILDTETIVATRFHNVVAALKVGRPVISIGYAEKNDALLAQVGLEAFCQPIEKLDLARLITEFQTMFERRAQFGDGIRRAAEQLQSRLADQDAYILDRFL